MVVVGLSLMLISFIRDSPALEITQDFYGTVPMIWGSDAAVSSTDYNNIMNNLPSAIDWKNSRVASNDVSVWD